MDASMYYPQVPNVVIEFADQSSKVISGWMAMVSETPTGVSWVQTGILGAMCLAIFWGFKTGFLALGRELDRALADGLKKDKIIEDQRNVIGDHAVGPHDSSPD
jgi:hypothetical protein